MSEILSSAQMRAAEKAVIETGQISGLDLMERAGQGVVDAIFETWPEFGSSPARALVLCGPGNNGGDGFVIARLLKGLGWQPDVFLLGKADALPPDARINYERWRSVGRVQPLRDGAIEGYSESFPETRLAIDAIFGTGLTRPFCSLKPVQMELNWWQSSDACPRVVSVDLPSGLCADSGRYLGFERENPFDSCIMANLTVTFHALKLGHVLAHGAIGSGRVIVKDIGVQGPLHDASVVQEVRSSRAMAHRLNKSTTGHKYSNGAALVLAGDMGKTGAARLAARAALRIGAGVVTLGVPKCAKPEVAAQITSLMMRSVDKKKDLQQTLKDPRVRAICLGPGLGLERARAFLPVAVRAKHTPYVVLDADALSAFEDDPTVLFEMTSQHCILTPHWGEFMRLFPDIAAAYNVDAEKGPAFSKVDAVRLAARRAGCHVLLKGADTVVASPCGRCAVHPAFGARSAPWLATAGSGDVLAGFITGLLARGFTPFEAATTSAVLHVECALDFGPGLIAEDLPERLPHVLQRIIQIGQTPV